MTVCLSQQRFHPIGNDSLPYPSIVLTRKNGYF